MDRSVAIALTAAGCLLGAIGGHQLGRDSVPPLPFAPEPPPKVPPPAPRGGATGADGWVAGATAALRDRDAGRFGKAVVAIASLDDNQLEQALAKALRTHNRDERRALVSRLLGELAGRDPEAAVLFLRDELHRDAWSYANAVFGPVIEDSSPAAALDLYHRLGLGAHGQLGISCLFPIFSRFGHLDIDGAIAAAATITGSGHRRQMISSICESSTDPAKRAKLLRWAGTLEGEEQRRAHGHLIEIWARRESPEAALAWVDDNITSPEAIAGAERAIADVMMADDPSAAAEWLLGRADDDNRADHLAHAVGRWANDAPNAAGTWLGNRALDASTDKAVARFARTIEREDPESAHAWACRITDDELRQRTLDSALMHWRRRDPSAAAAAAGE